MIPLNAVNTRQSTIPFNVPAPVGGLNGRDPLANMAASDAYLMDNAYPEAAKVVGRKGYTMHADTSLGAPVQTMDVYRGAAGEVMLAWAGDKVFNVSAPTPVQLASGLTTAVALNTMFSNAADNAQWLISVNGIDTPKGFNGTAISNLSMTGIPDPTRLNYVRSFKSRLLFAARDKLGFYYLPVGQIQGALSYFDLGQVARNGGYLQSIATYSEGGDTPNDYVVFITSTGECIVYSGTDPSSSSAWSLVGRYFASQPIGPNCHLSYNGDLILITMEGAIPFSQIRRAGDANGGGVAENEFSAITSKLGRYLSDFNVNSNVPGWQGVLYPRGGMLVLNVPATSSISGDYYQYVMNTTTKAWCRFTNLNGLCFTVFNKRLYFGDYGGNIMLGDEGRTDNGESIRMDVKQAYNYFGDERGAGPLQKHFQWASLIVACDGTPPLSGKFNTDFNENQPEYVNVLDPSDGADWDVGTWDLAEWAAGLTTQRFVITINRGGFAGSLWLRASLTGLTFEWFATQYTMQKTQGLLI